MKNKMEYQRVQTPGPRYFQGFRPDQIHAEAALRGMKLLRKASTVHLLEMENDNLEGGVAEELFGQGPIWDNTLRLKYGCTCGKCILGYLSPRIAFALSETAKVEIRKMREDDHDGENEQGEEGQRKKDNWRKVLLLECVSECLQPSEKSSHKTVPSPANLRWKAFGLGPDGYYLNSVCDSFIKDLLLRLFRYVESGMTDLDSDPAAEEEERDEDPAAEEEERIWREVKALPPCRNDTEVGFVKSRCFGWDPI
ncbi:hypothetical protein QBC34DRAFT_461218 [Podospora aff. communis PSN243]|uniref:Uncharacterized protein n=1 Tax=Podospora aff. communis PSN243 TaxID=3040156 RepID=A0AAV9GSH3_9PEZI|nr:hypothetical protein QBC34DRAFT_461218 [Podospora aff. communis PSN243]